MPNHKSAEKRVRSNERKRERNRLVKGKVKAALKRARNAILSGMNVDEARLAIRNAEKSLASAATKGVIKRGKASRLVSRLWQAFNREYLQSEANA
ncbi:MAG: 30S ribosomal protein S20 [Thermoplasmatales archaeon]